jgi:16S rRNA (guanine1516-N2)-methyltransferase
MTNEQLRCDFVGGSVGHRLKFGGGRGQALPKAAGFTKGRTPTIIDATAGLGRDAFLLASLGANVTLIERSVEMHTLLQDGLNKAILEGSPYSEIVERMSLVQGDAKDLLANLSADVILVDPMHPDRGNSALVKKEMRQIRTLVGPDPDAEELMLIALTRATKRVVLKWPTKAAPLPGLPQASHQIVGKSTRYDVFMIHE